MTLTVEEFGAHLLKTGDLDPVYNALHNTQMSEEMLHRLLVAYWCFYHLGAAAYIAETQRSPKGFWNAMQRAALNIIPPAIKPKERWPRSAERRHFRGGQAAQAVYELINKYRTATDAIYGFVDPDEEKMTYASVNRATQAHRGFGPWISWKVADMAERVLGYDIDFSQADLGIYKDPRQGAALIHYQEEQAAGRVYGIFETRPWLYPIDNEELTQTVNKYVKHFRSKKFKAPPRADRLVNVQEIETIFCKYKSHVKGHYPLNKDINEVRHGLEGWGDLAQQLQKGVPTCTQ
jgi:hypothetical protein